MFRRKPPLDTPDHEKDLHPSWRRYTKKYVKKKGLVRDLWLGVGGGVLLFSNSAGIIVVICLATTLLSFVVLGETA